MTAYFNRMAYDSSGVEYPYCHYVEIDQGQYSVSLKVRPDDPRVAKAKKDGVWTFEIEHCSIHNFDDQGYLQCKVCGWTP